MTTKEKKTTRRPKNMSATPGHWPRAEEMVLIADGSVAAPAALQPGGNAQLPLSR